MNSFTSSNLIRLLKSFTKEEIKELEKFIISPFHNNRNVVTRFFLEIKKYYPAFEHKDFSKEKVFTNLYPKEKYRDDVIRRLSSNLFKLCEEYGAYKIYRQEEFNYNRYLQEFHLTKSIDPIYLKHQKRTENYIEKQPLRDAKYFLNVNFLEEYRRIHQIKSDPLGKKISVQKQIDSVWKFAIITLMRLYKIGIEQTKQFNKKYNLVQLEMLLKIIENSDFIKSKAVEIWYLLINFQRDGRNTRTFNSLKELLKKNFHIFDPVESFIIHVSLLSYCYDMNVIPSKEFHKEEFEIIFQMFNADLLMDGDTMYSEWFMYAFITSVRAGEIKFAEKFLNDYKSKIHHKERENVINHANAELAFEKGDFNAALKYLSVPKYNNIGEKLRANQMYIKIYYELQLSEPFFYSVDSYRHYIKDEASLSQEVKVLRENFISFTSRLFKIRINETSTTIKQLKKEIMNSKILGGKWLLSKVAELEKEKK